MWRITLPTSLALTVFITAWAAPAGPTFEIVTAATPAASRSSFAELFDAKTTLPRSDFQVLAATEPLATDGFAPSDVAAAETAEEILQKNEMIGALAAPAGADEAADTAEAAKPEPIRLPPRRAIAREVVCETLADAATANNVPTPFFIRLIWRESGFNQNAVSPVGAQGVAQFMPATAAQHRLADPFDPLAALHASARFLRSLINQFGNVGLAAAAYNAGPGRVATWLASKKGKLPQETRDYVQNITGKAPEQWRGAAAAAPIKIPAAAPCQREAGLFAANGPAKIPLPPSIATASVTGKKQAADKSHDKLTTGTVTAAVSKTPGKSSTKTTTKVAQAAPSAHNAPRKPLQLAANKEPAPVKREAARTAAKDDKKRDRPVGKRVKVADAGRDGK